MDTSKKKGILAAIANISLETAAIAGGNVSWEDWHQPKEPEALKLFMRMREEEKAAK